MSTEALTTAKVIVRRTDTAASVQANSGSYFRQNTGAVIGLWIIIGLVMLAATADLVAPHSPIVTNNAAFLKPPFWQAGGSLGVSRSAPTPSAATCSRG